MFSFKRICLDFKRFDATVHKKFIWNYMSQWAKPSTPTSISTTEQPHVYQQTSNDNINKQLVPTAKEQVLDQFKSVGQKLVTTNFQNLQTFDTIPGPKFLKDVYKLWSYVPLLGTQLTARAVHYILNASSQFEVGKDSRLFRYLTTEYGPVVRLYGLLGGDVVLLSRPDHAAKVLENEGRYLCRSCLDCVDTFRKVKCCEKTTPSKIGKSTEEKFRIHSAVDQSIRRLMVTDLDVIERTCDEMVSRIKTIRNKQEEVPDKFWTELIKWSLQLQSYILFKKHVGLLKSTEIHPKSSLLLQSYEMAAESIRKCESGMNLWKFMETSSWRSLVENCNVLEGFIRTNIKKTQQYMKKSEQKKQISWALGYSLMKENVEPSEASTVLLDYLLIETNSIAYCTAFVIYYLAKYPRIQKKVYNEIVSEPEMLLASRVKSYPYLNAVIKECLRMKPPLSMLNRILSRDVQVHNYHIPKGTYVVLATHLYNYRDEHFEDPHRFHPSRWMNIEAPSDENLLMFASLPFGLGHSANMAQDLAKLQIALMISKIVRTFNVQYFYGDIDSTNNFLPVPNKALKFSFQDRSLI